jgi:hypothetical protein
MKIGKYAYIGVLIAASLVAMGVWSPVGSSQGSDDIKSRSGTRFRVDPFWPKPLPNNWLLGQVAGIASMPKTTFGLFKDPEVLPKTRQEPHRIRLAPTAVFRLRPSSNSIGGAMSCRPGADLDRASSGRRTSTESLWTTKEMCGSPAMERTIIRF